MKNLFSMLPVIAILGGCVPSATSTAKTNRTADTSGGSSDVAVQKVDKDDMHDIIREEKMLVSYDASGSELSFVAVGEGIVPLNAVSSAQALALTKRVAITDGYRQPASKLYSVKVNGKDTVKDAMLRSSTIIAQVNGLTKNASIINGNFNQGPYRVNLEPKIDVNEWRELFTY